MSSATPTGSSTSVRKAERKADALLPRAHRSRWRGTRSLIPGRRWLDILPTGARPGRQGRKKARSLRDVGLRTSDLSRSDVGPQPEDYLQARILDGAAL